MFRKKVVDPFCWKQKTMNVVMGESFELRVAHGIGQAFARRPFYLNELIVHTSNKIKQQDYIIGREETLFGRIYNHFAETEVYLIEMDGVAVIQLYEIIEHHHPIKIEKGVVYQVYHEDLKILYKRAKQTITEKYPLLFDKETLRQLY
ncbi:hypothetical protein RYZ26_11235 [Terasakiella sp. A23]|uniref:hypothetical protein n=1 Tax=Terasakiella sp. FCG-A23 TaxID=3080561 RepID=UPI0029546DCD|nr:hypothetical protein [Terasakiella sp. A23]MDV7340170.1 hypothetical protein [Terasakiella sp. A23]